MENPWKFIKLSDYESHMALGTVMQLQVLNRIMKKAVGYIPCAERNGFGGCRR